MIVERWEGVTGVVTTNVTGWEGFDIDLAMGEVIELVLAVDTVSWVSSE